MPRLIDADVLIEIIKDMQKDYPLTDRQEKSKAMRGALFIMKDLVENAPIINQWIPVSERLPKQGQWVIAWAKSNTDNDWEVPSIVQYMGDGKFRWNTILPISDEVIAWMPLPEPYKEKNNDANV